MVGGAHDSHSTAPRDSQWKPRLAGGPGKQVREGFTCRTEPGSCASDHEPPSVKCYINLYPLKC